MRLAIFALLLAGSSAGVAQRAVAPAGYYPSAYRGDMFTGTVKSVDPDADTVTLEYKGPAKTETLTVKLEGGCSVPSKTGAPMHAKDIPAGTILTTMYMPKSEKVNGEKQKLYVAIGIGFVQWMGNPVSPDHQTIFRCASGKGYNEFRAFGGPGAIRLAPQDLTVPK